MEGKREEKGGGGRKEAEKRRGKVGRWEGNKGEREKKRKQGKGKKGKKRRNKMVFKNDDMISSFRNFLSFRRVRERKE